jgi:hypothetical protein
LYVCERGGEWLTAFANSSQKKFLSVDLLSAWVNYWGSFIFQYFNFLPLLIGISSGRERYMFRGTFSRGKYELSPAQTENFLFTASFLVPGIKDTR